MTVNQHNDYYLLITYYLLCETLCAGSWIMLSKGFNCVLHTFHLASTGHNFRTKASESESLSAVCLCSISFVPQLLFKCVQQLLAHICIGWMDISSLLAVHSC